MTNHRKVRLTIDWQTQPTAVTPNTGRQRAISETAKLLTRERRIKCPSVWQRLDEADRSAARAVAVLDRYIDYDGPW